MNDIEYIESTVRSLEDSFRDLKSTVADLEAMVGDLENKLDDALDRIDELEGKPAKMKKTQAPKPAPKTAMSPDTMTRELAAGLRDAIEDTDSDYLKRDPEEAFVDLAARLVFRLRATLTVVPVPDAQERNRIAHAEAASRIFNILTRWILAKPGRSYDTKISPTGKFQLVVRTGGNTQLFFGGDIQDVYAQAAQTISFDEG